MFIKRKAQGWGEGLNFVFNKHQAHPSLSEEKKGYAV